MVFPWTFHFCNVHGITHQNVVEFDWHCTWWSHACRFFGRVFFFPKRRCGRIKNGCVYGKKACDCDFAILNFYCHRGIPENCFVEKSLSPRYCLYCRPRTNRNDNDSNKDPLTALSYLKKWTIISTALDFFRCTVDANVRSLFSEQARISPHNIDTLASR